MQIERNCKVCGKPFIAIKNTQLFCCRSHFKKDYYQRLKIKDKKESKKRPTFKCPVCRHESKLNFDPVRNDDMFETYICPFCGIPRAVVCVEHTSIVFAIGNTRTIQFVVSSAIVSGTGYGASPISFGSSLSPS